MIAPFRRAFLGVAVLASTARAQSEGDATSAIYRRYAGDVVRIQVVETGSAAKAVVGSGFYVSDAGHLITNYHVISKLVHDPTRYRAELTDAKGDTHTVRVLDVDVIHDLAVLASDRRPPGHFVLQPTEVPHGARLYSLGHPHDLGLSIVEGTYNGLLEHTLYPKIHFTGALNSGMSGGPAISDAGRIVGVNVSTEGNEVSFLVPIDRAIVLLDRVLAPGFQPSANLLGAVGAQLRAYQETYLDRMFADSVPEVTLGQYDLPTRPARFFNCWADADRTPDDPYEEVTHECSTDDYVFIAGDQSSGTVEFEHHLYTTHDLNRVRFYALLSQRFANSGSWLAGSKDEVTPFKCQTAHVQHGRLTMQTVLCMRRYRKLPGLYDAVLKAAILGAPNAGVVTTLTLSGVSWQNAERVARRYLEHIAWHG